MFENFNEFLVLMVELYFICFFIDLNLSYIRIYNKKIDYAFKVQAVNS